MGKSTSTVPQAVSTRFTKVGAGKIITALPRLLKSSGKLSLHTSAQIILQSLPGRMATPTIRIIRSQVKQKSSFRGNMAMTELSSYKNGSSSSSSYNFLAKFQKSWYREIKEFKDYAECEYKL